MPTPFRTDPPGNRTEKDDDPRFFFDSFLHPKAFYPSSFRRISGIVLGVLMLVLLACAVALNVYERLSPWIIPVLLLCAAAAVVSVVLLWRGATKPELLPQYLLCATLALLGIYLLTSHTASSGSLFWFIIYPPMLMFTLGLKSGTAIFAFFFLSLSALMLTPLDSLLADPIPQPARYRFLLSIFGAFVFGWCSEYVRHNTQLALNRSMERLEKEAVTDPLTGLGNRRDFQASFDWLLARSRRSGMPYSLALVDIDHFKKINDVYGHAVGDHMLRHVAHALHAHMRASDRVFRWGGEEFIVLMPETTADTARLAAERIRKYAENNPLADGEAVIPYTVSIGLYCSETGEGDNGNDEALLVADRNMYTAKSSGRNMVVG